MSDESNALWSATDSITKPSTVRVVRHEDADYLDQEGWERTTLCDVAAYRAATASHGTVPSLWEQAEMALTTGSESSSGTPSPLRTRSPADLNLMDQMADIKQTVTWQLQGRNVKARDGLIAQLRQLVAYVVTHEPEHIGWWEYRISQWRRSLETYLQAVETGPKPMRLRRRCPICKTEHIKTLNELGEEIMVRPIVAIYRDHMFRCFQCEACGDVRYSGADVYALRDEMEADEANQKLSDPEDKISA